MADIKEAVRKRYATAALQIRESGSCCGPDPAAGDGLNADPYATLATEGLPDAARLASLGCGNPTAVAALEDGEVVLDLGSGGGLDVFLSARRVGPSGKVYGLDMTDEMLELARRSQAEARIENVEFLKGEIEAIPLPDHSIDVIISNCVINLSVDKPGVFREAHRVLKPGGRLAVTDIVATRRFTEEEQSDLVSWTGCLAGALHTDDFVAGLEGAGFHDVELEVTHDVAPGAVSAIIRATA